MISIVTCQCGSVESLIRNFLHSAGYPEWHSIQINKGREKSLSVINNLPPSIGKDTLQEFLRKASKWAVIIGYDDTTCKWSDIAHNGNKSRIEAKVLLEYYS